MRQYETREVTHGNSWGAFASITKNEAGEVEFGVPKIATGLRETSFETSQDSSPFHADNQEHVRLNGAESTEGTLKFYQLSKDFLTNHLGKKLMPNGGLTNTGLQKSFVWQHIETVTDEFGEEYEELNVYYNVKAGKPTAASKTDEESVEAKEFEIPVTASPNNAVLDDEGKAVTHFSIRKTTSNAALFELAYTKVILPTDNGSAVEGE